MIWNGAISYVGDRARGHLEDEWHWLLALEGTPLGANRMALECHLARRGAELTAEEHPASHRQHEALTAGRPRLTGELVRSQIGAGRLWRWTGSIRGPWLMRIENPTPWPGEGPIELRAVPTE